MPRHAAAALAALCLAALGGLELPPEAALAAGSAAGSVAEQRCGGCHATGMTDTSPNPRAPALRDMFKRYPIDALDRALGEGLEVGHRGMPRFTLTPDERTAIVTHLESLDPCARPSSDEAAMRRCFGPM